MYMQTQQLLCVNLAGAGRHYVACKPSQANIYRPACYFPEVLTLHSLTRGFFMINLFGIPEKNIHKIYCHGHCSLPGSSLCFGFFETIFKGKPGVKLACISLQIGSDSSIGSMTAIRHALKGTTWPPIPFILVQTGL